MRWGELAHGPTLVLLEQNTVRGWYACLDCALAAHKPVFGCLMDLRRSAACPGKLHRSTRGAPVWTVPRGKSTVKELNRVLGCHYDARKCQRAATGACDRTRMSEDLVERWAAYREEMAPTTAIETAGGVAFPPGISIQ